MKLIPITVRVPANLPASAFAHFNALAVALAKAYDLTPSKQTDHLGRTVYDLPPRTLIRSNA